MKILVINAGSSSLKFQLIDMDNESVIAKGLVERIGTVDPTTDLTYEWKGQKIKQKQLKKCDTHARAMEIVLDVLVGKDCTAAEYDAYRAGESDTPALYTPEGFSRMQVISFNVPSRRTSPWARCTTPPT